jgi:hypothetical protein
MSWLLDGGWPDGQIVYRSSLQELRDGVIGWMVFFIACRESHKSSSLKPQIPNSQRQQYREKAQVFHVGWFVTDILRKQAIKASPTRSLAEKPHIKCSITVTPRLHAQMPLMTSKEIRYTRVSEKYVC